VNELKFFTALTHRPLPPPPTPGFPYFCTFLESFATISYANNKNLYLEENLKRFLITHRSFLEDEGKDLFLMHLQLRGV
jgi:hypothetical protein